MDLSSGDDTRSMTAAALVEKLFMPENFVLLLDENRFGPVNAAVSSVSSSVSLGAVRCVAGFDMRGLFRSFCFVSLLVGHDLIIWPCRDSKNPIEAIHSVLFLVFLKMLIA